MYLLARERKVIELLLTKQEAITVKEIAKTLDVSERTIHRDLKGIEKVLFDHNLELVKKSGVGLRVMGDDHDKQQLEFALSNEASSDFTPDERQAIILSTLLESKEPVKLFTLANELNVTIATISNDLDQLEEQLTSFHLHLIRKRGYGVRLDGDEANKRAAISNLISKYVDPFDFVSLLKENIQKKSIQQVNTISDRLLGLVDPEMLSTIEKRVEQARNELPHELADSSYIGLVVHLALAMERLQKGQQIKFDQAFMKQIEGTKEFEIAKKIIQDLEMKLSMAIPNDEIGYITMHLMGAKLRLDQHYLLEDPSLDIAYQARKLIQYVSSRLKVDLIENAVLLNDLVTHLKPTIYRLKQGMNINNPLIEEITKDYPDLFQLIKDGVRETFPDIMFPDDEVGYLVLHFAATLLHDVAEINLRALVICSSGIGTAKILATKLMQQFPEIKRVENKSLFDMQQLDIDTYDIVVSTIPLKGFAGNYILTSPILTKAEVQRVKKAVRHKKLILTTTNVNTEVNSELEDRQSTDCIANIEILQHYTTAVLDVLTSFYTEQITEKRSMESILHLICHELVEKQLLLNGENVVEKLLKRENAGGLGIPNTSLALYHTRSTDVEKPVFSIYSLTHPVIVSGMDEEELTINTVLMMLAPEATNQEVLEVLSFLSSLLLQGQASIKLFESGNEKQIKQFLSKQFHSFLHEKNLL